MGSTVQVIGLFSANARNQPSISEVGKKADDMNIVTKIKGNVAPTASWDPVRIAMDLSLIHI